MSHEEAKGSVRRVELKSHSNPRWGPGLQQPMVGPPQGERPYLARVGCVLRINSFTNRSGRSRGEEPARFNGVQSGRKCVAWVTAAPARSEAATIAASASSESDAPAL